MTRKLEDLKEGEWLKGKVRNVERCVEKEDESATLSRGIRKVSIIVRLMAFRVYRSCCRASRG